MRCLLSRLALGLALAGLPEISHADTAVSSPTIELRDEGASQGGVKKLDCTGAGVTCSRSGVVGTINIAGGGGAPTNATYLTTTADATLSNEVVVGVVDDSAFTSPSIASYNGILYMTYTAWADSPMGASPGVVTGAAYSSNDGATWTKFGAIDWADTFGVEASVHHGLDGYYYRISTETFASQDILSLGIASHPLGPYLTKQAGILTIGGAGVGEVDSITAGSLFFHPTQPRVYLFYSAVAAGGFPWMTSLAIATY